MLFSGWLKKFRLSSYRAAFVKFFPCFTEGAHLSVRKQSLHLDVLFSLDSYFHHDNSVFFDVCVSQVLTPRVKLFLQVLKALCRSGPNPQKYFSVISNSGHRSLSMSQTCDFGRFLCRFSKLFLAGMWATEVFLSPTEGGTNLGVLTRQNTLAGQFREHVLSSGVFRALFSS